MNVSVDGGEQVELQLDDGCTIQSVMERVGHKEGRAALESEDGRARIISNGTELQDGDSIIVTPKPSKLGN